MNMNDNTIEKLHVPRPFDCARATRRPIVGPHWLFVSGDDACLWVVGGPRFDNFLLNQAAYDAYRALPARGVKWLRFQGGSQNLDTMLRLDDLKVDPRDMFNVGDKGPAYRVHLGMSGPTTFTPPADSGISF